MTQDAKKIVVLDFDIPELLNNKIFDPVLANKVSHTLLPFVYLHDEAKKVGIELVTPDIYLAMESKPKNALLYSHLTSPFTLKLIASGLKPLILTCQESPFIATRFYMNLRRISSAFKYSFVFSGMRGKLSKNTIYHQMFFPENFELQNFQALPFSRKKLLTMISGNKRVGSWKKSLLLKILYGLSVKEIYGQRQKAVNFFAAKGNFDLYGRGWDKGGQNEEETQNIKKVFKGQVEDKLATLKGYKFAFCFENSIFPGYITEKIFDCFFAGVVPVYLGAPDVYDFVPKGAFIDFSDYEDFADLEKYIAGMSEEIYNSYIANIREFLNSPAYYRFTKEAHVKEVLKLFLQEF